MMRTLRVPERTFRSRSGTGPEATGAIKTRASGILWLGVVLASGYWLLESLIHTFVFDGGTLGANLLGGHDPNELWMRVFIAVLLVGLYRASLPGTFPGAL